MNYPHFVYPPRDSGSPSTHHPTGASQFFVGSQRPQLRVTPDAVEPLLFALVHTIEYNLSIGREGVPMVITTPKIMKSAILGGICHPSNETNAPSMVESLARAVATAKALPWLTPQSTPFKLRVRVCRNVVTKTWLRIVESSQKQIICEFEFKIIKTKTEVCHEAPSSSVSNTSFSTTTTTTFGSPATVVEGCSPVAVYSNDPDQVRQAIDFILLKCFSSIDAEWYKDLRAGELLYEVTVLDKW